MVAIFCDRKDTMIGDKNNKDENGLKLSKTFNKKRTVPKWVWWVVGVFAFIFVVSASSNSGNPDPTLKNVEQTQQEYKELRAKQEQEAKKAEEERITSEKKAEQERVVAEEKAAREAADKAEATKKEAGSASSTYVAPPQPTAATNCANGTYVNVAGNTVCRPSANDTGGATAICKDGTYSYSQSRKGTCSKHGGVATWL